eukprot:gb/GFBE01012583.1/.p1 GENE.gb/GFBE01012583.1/~~gb/GFBE01012583.1/.p1  ORF type:complete len:225 (+),score=19.00 gb/GFBE01012583.1/:1-675(+)
MEQPTDGAGSFISAGAESERARTSSDFSNPSQESNETRKRVGSKASTMETLADDDEQIDAVTSTADDHKANDNGKDRAECGACGRGWAQLSQPNETGGYGTAKTGGYATAQTGGYSAANTRPRVSFAGAVFLSPASTVHAMSPWSQWTHYDFSDATSPPSESCDEEEPYSAARQKMKCRYAVACVRTRNLTDQSSLHTPETSTLWQRRRSSKEETEHYGHVVSV